MKSLTVAYITARPEPELPWFLSSLAQQVVDPTEVIIVDALHPRPGQEIDYRFGPLHVRHVEPKPTIWAGKHRLTTADWWAASNARNTAICLCQTEWIAFVDDRLVLMADWAQAIYAAMCSGPYVICGPYEKRTGMTVENGYIKHGGIIVGRDDRLRYVAEHYSDPRHQLQNPYPADGGWTYGASLALPLAWCYAVNGFDETCDGLSMEDSIFGLMLKNSGYPIKYDTRMMIVEDRTPERLGPPRLRRDKGVSPKDKSHALLDMLKVRKTAVHPWNLHHVRAQYLSTGQWPIPHGPTVDWYDGEPLNQMQPA